MPATQPIPFYELVAQKGAHAPFFSPATIRARLAFALKGVPIETVEVTYEDLLETWSGRLGVELATVPFIQKPDGSFLMDSYKIIDWIEETYPNRPSVYAPDQAARPSPPTPERESAELSAFTDRVGSFKHPFSWNAFALYAPLILPTFSPATQAYWISDERMGEEVWQGVLDMDQDQVAATVRRGVAELSALLSPAQLFFQSPSKPGYKDLVVVSAHRMLAATSRANVERTYFEGGLEGWLDRMHEFFAAELEDVLARDPK